MKRSVLSDKISGRLKTVYDVMDLTRQVRVTYVMSLFGNLCDEPFQLLIKPMSLLKI